jgi:hypothetical protein
MGYAFEIATSFALQNLCHPRNNARQPTLDARALARSLARVARVIIAPLVLIATIPALPPAT